MAENVPKLTVICRDCLSSHARAASRCESCGSPRMLYHPEMDGLAIAHIDCDAFYATIEKRDNPHLAHKPVIVGGGKRGVVSTACYIARTRGVHSAMPMFQALKACPEAIVIKPDMEKYVAVARQIRERMLMLTPLVEPLSIDEAFLDLSGTRRLHKRPPAAVLAEFAANIERDLQLTVSIGLSYCKFLAKVASDRGKPRGFSIIGRSEAKEFLAAQEISIIWGVGKIMQARLARDGLRMIGQLQAMDKAELIRRYGVIGQRLHSLANGEDDRPVSPREATKSISSETTFHQDIADSSELSRALRNLSERVCARLKKKHLAGQTITLKLRTTDFRTRTRSRTLPEPTQLADKVYRTGLQLLLPEADGTLFRLIGVGVSALQSDENADPDRLDDEAAARRAKAERAMDRLRARFGDSAIGLGLIFESRDRRRP